MVVSMHIRLSALAVTLFLLTGCPTPPKPAPRVTPLNTSPNLERFRVEAEKRARAAQEERAELEFKVSQPQKPGLPSPSSIPQTNASVALALPLHLDSFSTWVSWVKWSETNGWRKPRLALREPALTYELETGQGNLELRVGSRYAVWNGLTFGLGFVPVLTNGEPYVHYLDLAKNFEPLTKAEPMRKSPFTVVLDPGHGGENTGARSVLNLGFEKQFTLDWAIRAEKLLSEKGFKVFLTRTNDSDLSLTQRVAFADFVRADVFLSLHFNSIESASPGREEGLETYCLTPVGMPSNLVREFEDDPKKSFPNNGFDEENLRLAVRIQGVLVKSTGHRDRGVRRARFMTVLREQNRPAVLIEGGFLSSPAEAREIANPRFRQKLAEAVASAF